MKRSESTPGPSHAAHLPDEQHDELRGLCALSTTGELTDEEWARLDSHLVSCDECSTLVSQFEVVAHLVRPEPKPKTGHLPFRPSSPRTLVAEFPPRASSKLIGRILPLGVAAALLLVTGFAGYQVGVARHQPPVGQGNGARPVPVVAAALIKSYTPIDDKPNQQSPTPRSASTEKAALLKELDNSKQAQQEADRELNDLREERSALQAQLNTAQDERDSLQGRVATLTDQSASDAIKASADAKELKDLKQAIESRDREIARAEALLDRDRDIRGLIGARDLYIAEIYDVAKNGETQKPFGRVFYTKDKSLVFYGYDLKQQKDIAKDASFQVWGRKTSSQSRDISLGLLYQDDSKQNRWVLKFNDAKTISQMDAVFVTAEPEGGSSRPTGKQLLFTYLHIDPNHP